MRFPSTIGSSVSLSLRAFQIYGANTNVGKTIVSTILCKALRRKSKNHEGVWYLKPVSTGAKDDADDRHVRKYAKDVETRCLWQFDAPISPHLAAPKTPDLSDEHLLSNIHRHISKLSTGTVLVETAGGVHSPTPSGTSQADAYRPLRLPIIFIADPALGGISVSISAFESLHIRGYDIERVILFANDCYRNDSYLLPYFNRHGISTTVLPPPPEKHVDGDEVAMQEYYTTTSGMGVVDSMISDLALRHQERIETLKSMPERAAKTIWYPFTQHGEVSPKSIQAIDSAHGDFFQTYSPITATPQQLLNPKFDGSASWWTQGLGHANPVLTLSAAYAAGRYGHVMFPGSIHAPALELAELLLEKIGNPRLSRVFYSDNGSTGAEVALKMALRASRVRYGWSADDEVGIIGLKGAYHGDTIGAMDCADPGPFNQEVEWYRGRGYWFDFPKVGMKDGVWNVEVSEEMQQELGVENIAFNTRDEVFDVKTRERGDMGKKYAAYIRSRLERVIKDQGRKFGAVMIEPVVLGAAGMHFAPTDSPSGDPLFQRTLVNVVRASSDLFSANGLDTPFPSSKWSGLPIVFDEVFTGLYRLGRVTSSSFLGVNPDISVHAKLLTGGLLPLCVTMAGESIFEAFLSDKKNLALLHGHSYTAHAIGCNVAKTSVKTMVEMEMGEEWWSLGFVEEVSKREEVHSVFALGTVLAITLKDSEAGYASTASGWLLAKLKEGQVDARALGNVVYVMTSVMSGHETVRRLEETIRNCFEE